MDRHTATKLSAIDEFDRKIKEKASARRTEIFQAKVDAMFKTCDELPEDWSLKTQIDVQVVTEGGSDTGQDESVTDALNHRTMSKILSYYIFCPSNANLMQFSHEN